MEKIGKILKEKREAQRLTIDAVNSSTRIPLKFVTALEEDNVKGFPAELYYIGSLRKYAQFLGLDDNLLVSAYKEEKANREKPACPPKREPCAKPSRKFWGYSLVAIAVVFLIAYAWLNIELEKISKQVVVVKPRIVHRVKQAQPKQTAKESRQRAQAAVPKPAVQAGKALVLEIEAVDSSWVKITSDGKVEYSAILEKGTKREWTADSKFGLVVGYAPGVSVKLNGRTIDVKKYAKQDISELTLTTEDLNKIKD